MRKKPALPCTGRTSIEGFDEFLKAENQFLEDLRYIRLSGILL